MTDNEVIKALECCLDISPSTCKNCSLFNVTNSTMVCSKIATKFALGLINRQQAEIERLKTNLNVELENFATEYDNKIKAEAIKEFAERLKDKITMSPHSFISIDKWYIDNLVKEMEGNNND